MKKSDYEILSNSLKDEPTFGVNVFGKNEILTKVDGLAVKLQNLCLTRPNTLPNMGSFGLGLQDYLMEIADERTLSDIRSLIQNGVDKWVPDAPIENILVQYISEDTLGTAGKGLFIGFELAERIDGKDTILLGFSKQGGDKVKSYVISK